jgi:hypothetical protein
LKVFKYEIQGTLNLLHKNALPTVILYFLTAKDSSSEIQSSSKKILAAQLFSITKFDGYY